MSSFAMHYVFGKKLDPPGPSPVRPPVSFSPGLPRFFQLPQSSPNPPCLLSISSPPVPLPFSYHFVLLPADYYSPLLRRRRFQLISLLLFPPPPLGRAGCWTRGESVRVVYRIDFVPLKQPTSLCSSLRTNVSMRSMASKHGKLLYAY